MTSESCSVLLIGYNYPPGGGVGSIRITKFAKYLPSDWEIHVLTTNKNAGTQTNGKFDDGDDVTIHRINELWPNAPKDFDKLRWVPPIVWKVYQLHLKHEFDAIWHTSGPFLPLTAAPILKRILDVIYIADLRDSWTLHPYKSERTLFGRVYDGVSEMAEPRVLRSVDAVTTATEGITNAYCKKYPSIQDKFHTIVNGYDPSDFPQMNVEPTENFTVVYVGKFSTFRDPKPFLRSLADLQDEYEIDFVHVGTPEQVVQLTVSKLGLEKRFDCTGYIERSEVSRQIHRADVGLAVAGDSPQEMTTKIFDYIACRTPILACGPTDGSMANVVQKFKHGYTVPNRRGPIIRQMIKIADEAPLELGSGPYNQYTRAHAAESLKKVFIHHTR